MLIQYFTSYIDNEPPRLEVPLHLAADQATLIHVSTTSVHQHRFNLKFYFFYMFVSVGPPWCWVPSALPPSSCPTLCGTSSPRPCRPRRIPPGTTTLGSAFSVLCSSVCHSCNVTKKTQVAPAPGPQFHLASSSSPFLSFSFFTSSSSFCCLRKRRSLRRGLPWKWDRRKAVVVGILA